MKSVLKNPNHHLHNLQLSSLRWSERMEFTAWKHQWHGQKGKMVDNLTAFPFKHTDKNIPAGPFNTASGNDTPLSLSFLGNYIYIFLTSQIKWHHTLEECSIW